MSMVNLVKSWCSRYCVLAVEPLVTLMSNYGAL
jgi:hypothetical protein